MRATTAFRGPVLRGGSGWFSGKAGVSQRGWVRGWVRDSIISTRSM